MKTHQITLNDKARFLEKDVFDRDGYEKALEEKILKLEANLSKTSLTFNKYEASASTMEKVWLNQKHSSYTHGIGYEDKSTMSKQYQISKPVKSVIEEMYNPSYFVPTYHQCSVKGYIRPHCPRLETKHVHS